MERNYNRRENGEGRNYRARVSGSNSRENRPIRERNERRDEEHGNREGRVYDGNRSTNSSRRFNSGVQRERREGDRTDNYNRGERDGENRRSQGTGYVKRDYYKNDERKYSGYRDSRDNRENRENRDNNNREEGREKKFVNRENRERRTDNYTKRPSNPVGKPYYRKDEITDAGKEELRKKHYSKKKQLVHRLKTENENASLRLNRYISMGGICSRRDADALILEGRVKVNGEIVQTVGTKVQRTDQVEVDEVLITPEKKVYLVLNKPKDYVTTVEDPLERRTVMSLIEEACKERIYPIGRLDRQTTGVLLFTNDGDLAKKLTHPKYEHKKIYHVFLDKPLESRDMDKIINGVELEDGIIKADEVNYVSPDQTQIGIEIHSGKNRIVRRIFEKLDYQIIKLDRVYFAGITKKNLPRGRWRFLTPQEVKILKIYNS